MSVKKIVLSNPDIFNIETSNIQNEKDAFETLLRHALERSREENKEQSLVTSYFAICLLFEIGLLDDAISLAKNALKKADAGREYFIAADLAHKISAYHILIDEWQTSENFRLLSKKYTTLFSQQSETIHLFGNAIKNSPLKLNDKNEIAHLDKDLQSIFPKDNPWYKYCHFLLETFSILNHDLEHELLKAINYFEKQDQPFFAGSFYYSLVKYYLTLNDLQSAETQLLKMRQGSWYWFKSYYFYITALLVHKDLKSAELCNEIMSHSSYSLLEENVKEEWKALYKKTIKLLLMS